MADIVVLCKSQAYTALEILGIDVHVIEGSGRTETLEEYLDGKVLLVEEPLLQSVQEALRKAQKNPFIVVLPSPEKGFTEWGEDFARRVLGMLGVVSK